MLTLLLMAFFYAATPTFGFLTIIWKNSDLLNVALRCWFALLTVLGCFVIYGVLAP